MKQTDCKLTTDVFMKTYQALRLFKKHHPEDELTLESFQSFTAELIRNDWTIPVVFNPPQKFICLKTVVALEYDENGSSISSVTSEGESVYYLLDEKLELYLSKIDPSFSC